ncbi:MAG: 30S ribosomal protein S6 [Bdellovibrionaceae bacterium]|nr:30S ribosomal protein S6 [Pseudobdellovibrionaceae bacterium]
MEWKMDKENNNYELVVIMHPETSEEDTKAFFKRVDSTLESQFKGKIESINTWGNRRLANPIKRIANGVYFHVLFSAQASSIIELERIMGIDDKVLRFMHTVLDKRVPLSKHLDQYHTTLQEVQASVEKRLAKRQTLRKNSF